MAKQSYLTCDKEFYASYQIYGIDVVISQKFFLLSKHETLSFLNSQEKLKFIHGSWFKFLQCYSFVLKHRLGVENKVVNALSCRIALVLMMSIIIKGLERHKEHYELCLDFRMIHTTLSNWQRPIIDHYTVKETSQCGEFMLVAFPDILRMIRPLKKCQFHQPILERDIAKLISQCRISIGQTPKVERQPLYLTTHAILPLTRHGFCARTPMYSQEA